MQKKLIALAVAGLVSGGAFAQSNVTVYGIADVFVNHIKADGKDGVNAIDGGGLSGSRIGFKGEEALGNGMKALFTLEYAIANDSDTGIGAQQAGWSATAAARQQYVGLSSGFGTVVAGRLQTTAYDWGVLTNPVAGSAFDTSGKVGARTVLVAGNGGRASNAIAYVSPSFGGFTVAYNHARLTEAANNNIASDATANMLSATYQNGPIAASLIYSKLTGQTGNTTLPDDVKELGIGGSYDFGVAKAFASYQTYKDKNATDEKDTKWQLGVSVPLGNGKILGTYGKVSVKTAYTVTGTSYDDAKGFALVYDHNLSKRTDVYVGFAKLSDDGIGTTGIKGITPTAGDSTKVYGVGLRHSF